MTSQPDADKQRYEVLDDVTLSVSTDDTNPDSEIYVYSDDKILYTGTTTSEKKRDSLWSEEIGDDIIDEVSDELSGIDRDRLRRGIKTALIEASIPSQNKSVIPVIGYPEIDSRQFGIRQCAPPEREAVAIHKEAHWEELKNERFDEWKRRSELEIWADAAGLGKTTNVAKGATAQNDSYVLYLPKHENAHDFRIDDNKPDVDLHFKGPEQPQEDTCMDAKVKGEQCEDHHESNSCPKMCPIYDLPKDDEKRKRFVSIANQRGPTVAHRIVDPHDDEKCAWQNQWETVDEWKEEDRPIRIVTVHNYLTVDQINTVGHNIIDDIQSLLTDEQTLSLSELHTLKETLGGLSDRSAIPNIINAIVAFVESLITEIESGDPADLSELAPPDIDTQSPWITRRIDADVDRLAEALAWVKHAYHEALFSEVRKLDGILQSRVHFDVWDDAPLGLDMIFAAAAEAGLSHESVRRTIAASPGVEACPSCDSTEFGISKGFQLTYNSDFYDVKASEGDAGFHVCDKCGWHEYEDRLTENIDELPRATAWINEEDQIKRRRKYTLEYQCLPLIGDLPDPSDTLILDATPTVEKYALLFGLDVEDVVVTGDDPVELNAEITQIIDGQYHRGTLARDDKGGQKLRARLNTLIDILRSRHRGVLFVGHRKNEDLYEISSEEWMYFHAGRGLDRRDPEAVMIIGAPHPNEDDLRRKAKLLATDRNDIRVGGEEHSSRRSEDGVLAASPPIYRKYYYDDGTGTGRAASTKHYTGLVGDLFQDTREHELVQLAHRLRPVIADETKHVYLITNVPTELPINTLAKIDELADPVYTQTEVSENALLLLEQCQELLEGERRRQKDRWFRNWDNRSFEATVKEFHTLVNDLEAMPDRSERTVRHWINQLEGVGLLTESDEYQHQSGRVYHAELPTLKKALLVLNNNSFFKVHDVRRLSEKIEATNGSLDWLDWAYEWFNLPDTMYQGGPQ